MHDDLPTENQRELQLLQEKANRADQLQDLLLKLDRKAQWLRGATIALSIIVLIGGLAAFRANHYNIVLALNGITETHRLGEDVVVTFDDRWFGNNNAMRSILWQEGDEMGNFVSLRQNSLGFWFIASEYGGVWRTASGGGLVTWPVPLWQLNHFDDPRYGRHRHNWATITIHQRHLGTTTSISPSWDFGRVAYYHNTNAIALIELDHSLLPDGITADIRQWGSFYVIQLDIAIRDFWQPEITPLIEDLVRDFVE
ncbi:MAG: hypothetical protein FWC76_00095 [Defluviitaleaceae bacterium]|nr:hypothetical protein [Defluviitaleaceae bacterium]